MSLSDPKCKEALKHLQQVFEQAALDARQTLLLMMKRDVIIKVAGIKELPFEEVSHFRFPEDVPVAIIVLRLQGDAEGYLAFIMFEESAKRVNQILWEEVPETCEVLNISNISALKEMANIVGSCFLNKLADRSGIELRPSEPLFVYDLMAAVMETLLLEQSYSSEKAILVDTEIESPKEGISFDILFLPSTELLSLLCRGFESHD